jgi:drug/metabolite transporter (DMT)-like permease
MSAHHEFHLKGYLILLLAAVLYGSYGVWSKLMGETFPPFFQAWMRGILIVAMMLPYLLLTRSIRKIDRADWGFFTVYFVLTACTQAPLYYAFNHAPIGTVQLIFYATLVITAYIFAKFYIGESITRIKLAAMAVAFVGLVFVFGTSVLVFAPLGLSLAIFNGFASGGEMTSAKRIPEKYSSALVAWYGWVFVVLTHFVVSIIFEQQVAFQATTEWGWLVAYAVVNMAAFWLGLVGYRMVDASIASLIGLLEVIFAVALGALLFDENLRAPIYIGGVLIIIAAMLPDIVKLLDERGKTS